MELESDHQSLHNSVSSSPLTTDSRSMRHRWKWRLLALFAALFIFIFCWLLLLQSRDDTFAYAIESFNGSIDNNSSFSTPRKPLILMWTRVFREQSLQLQSDCPLYNRCTLTYDHGALPHADAIVYHVPDIKWVHPLVTSNMAYDLPELPDLPPQHRLGRALNVFLSQENPSTLDDYYMTKQLGRTTKNFFHWTITYLRSSSLPMPYGGFWVPPEETRRLGFAPVQLPNDKQTILKDKKVKGVLWFVSNCDSKSKRELAIDTLSKHFPVDIGGKCAKTEAGRTLCPRASSCDHIYAQYYFYVAAENDNCKDYVTEKYWTRYQLPSVPIVMRKYIYEGLVPDNSYIAMDQFESPKAMADHLIFLVNNSDEYLKYFGWRSQNWSVAPWNHDGYRIGQCALCERLINNSTAMPEPIPNAVEWFERESQCEGDTFARQWTSNEVQQ